MKCRAVALLLLCISSLSAVAEDYTFLWWADGWRGRAADWRKVLHLQTNAWGAAIDVERPGLLHLGAVPKAKAYAAAVSESNAVIERLPNANLLLEVQVKGQKFLCTAAAGHQADEANFPVRIIDSGRFVQRADILHLVFTGEDGAKLEAEARLEILATPQRLRLLLEVTPDAPLEDVVLRLDLQQGATGASATRPYDALAAGEPAIMGLAWPPQGTPDTPDTVTVSAMDSAGAALPVQADGLRGWYAVDLPEQQWEVAAQPDRLDRFPVKLTNDGNVDRKCLLLFAFDGAAFSGVTGLCPILRDKNGVPTGLPVQLSKNWHRLPDRAFLYQGPWVHAFAEIPVAAGATWEGELAITYARWGGVPSASHAQLCLIGWGVNQLWDQAAIGSWGESITYDPDINLNRSMIDDIRPLMVTGMNGGQWEWTANVGGGDFLVYFDAAGRRQYLTRMRTAYLSQGPNLTDVVYSGVSADGRIAARIEVSTPRCDDVNRAYHRVRYDVLEDADFSRLAFYQLGADRYNDHGFSTIARGNSAGLEEQWETERGGKRYLRSGLPCSGPAPWFSLHGGERNVHHPKGVWANRGLVIREWKARLGGQDCPDPYAAVYGTDNGVPSANLELAPPPGCTSLKAGDFVEAEIELLIVPMNADDYYGPNSALRDDLAENGNTWRVIHRLAAANDLQLHVEKGSLVRRYPPVIKADGAGAAEFEITGGAAYVPVTIAGLPQYSGYSLTCDGEAIDQQVHGNDFWQTTRDDDAATWSQTYNVNLDGGPAAQPRRFVLLKQ